MKRLQLGVRISVIVSLISDDWEMSLLGYLASEITDAANELHILCNDIELCGRMFIEKIMKNVTEITILYNKLQEKNVLLYQIRMIFTNILIVFNEIGIHTAYQRYTRPTVLDLGTPCFSHPVYLCWLNKGGPKILYTRLR